MERVLLIDDDELVAGSLREHLVRGGMRVDVAIDYATAAHLMNERAYDVVVIDPYFTGRVLQEDDRVLETIRAQQPSAALIVLTAYASPSMTETAAQVRATAFLAKPQSIVTLGGVVTDACRNATAVFRGPSE